MPHEIEIESVVEHGNGWVTVRYQETGASGAWLHKLPTDTGCWRAAEYDLPLDQDELLITALAERWSDDPVDEVGQVIRGQRNAALRANKRSRIQQVGLTIKPGPGLDALRSAMKSPTPERIAERRAIIDDRLRGITRRPTT